MSYFSAHWLGRQSFAQSFWINFAAPRVLLWLTPFHLWKSGPLPVWAFLLLAATDVVFFVWQTIGMLRSGEKYFATRGSMAPVWGSYVAIGVVTFALATQSLTLFQLTEQEADTELFTTRMTKQDSADFSLTITTNGSKALFKGTIALGLSRAMADLLLVHPNIETLIITSNGGNIYEARGLAKILMENEIDTHVTDECSSACTIIYLAGKTRTIGPLGKLGFHAYQLDTHMSVPNVNIEQEQERDRLFFGKRAVKPDFLQKIFAQTHNSIWFPTTDQLLDSGAIHKISAATAQE